MRFQQKYLNGLQRKCRWSEFNSTSRRYCFTFNDWSTQINLLLWTTPRLYKVTSQTTNLYVELLHVTTWGVMVWKRFDHYSRISKTETSHLFLAQNTNLTINQCVSQFFSLQLLVRCKAWKCTYLDKCWLRSISKTSSEIMTYPITKQKTRWTTF